MNYITFNLNKDKFIKMHIDSFNKLQCKGSNSYLKGNCYILGASDNIIKVEGYLITDNIRDKHNIIITLSDYDFFFKTALLEIFNNIIVLFDIFNDDNINNYIWGIRLVYNDKEIKKIKLLYYKFLSITDLIEALVHHYSDLRFMDFERINKDKNIELANINIFLKKINKM